MFGKPHLEWNSPARRSDFIAWANILIQLFIPCGIAFTPAFANAPTSKSVNPIVSTEPYRLAPGETLESVAKKYHLSVDKLKQINQYRIHSKPYEALTVGDELDVPRKHSPFLESAQPEASTSSLLGSHLVTGATLLSSDDVARSAARLVRSSMNNEINNSVQQWLNQFGSAQVQLNMNDDFQLDGSAIDVLFPIYDSQTNTLFTQLGGRNKDSRNTLNLGVGLRTFQDNWMFGMNVFFDNDLTGKNRRIGAGIEAWMDYLKLSANGYFGLTGWNQSRSFSDYNERPAHGYDLRAEAYFPSHPQLGGKLVYEQYRGDDVALFGNANRQKDPYAITAGVNYTPFPLLTVGAEHRTGKGGSNDSRIQIQLNYRFGESWLAHITPTFVAANRTLMGSRYDLVERNNQIILDYQKQELIHIVLPEQQAGESISSLTVNAQVRAKYGLERIDWSSADLIAAGGTLVQVAPQTITITLPSYQSSRNSNVYTLSAVAYDRQGNVSPRATMQIVVLPEKNQDITDQDLADTAEIVREQLTITRNNALANGIATNAVQARVTDARGNPVAGQTVSFTADNGAAISTTAETGADGVATATLTNTTAGTTAVTAEVNDSRQTVNTTFVADASSATLMEGSLTITRNNALANGIVTNAVQARVTDAHGNPVAGQTVNFTADNGATINTTAETGADGVATATLTNTTAGTTVVTAEVNGQRQSQDVAFVADPSSLFFTGTPTVTGDKALANGSAAVGVDFVVKDASGNAVANRAVVIHTNNGAQPDTVTVQTDSNGVAHIALTNTTAGITVVTAEVNGQTQSQDVTFVADPSSLHFTGSPTVTGDKALANGSAAVGVDFVVKDASGNAVANREVVIHTNNGAQPDTVTVQTDSNGVAHIALTNTTAGITVVTAEVNGQTQSQDVTFVSVLTRVSVAGLVNGYPLVGSSLAAEVRCATGCPTSLTYQWQIEDAINSGSYIDISGATSPTYMPLGADQRRRIQVIVGAR
ncbi:ZirU family protein [Edwardsiella tarda]|uniref:ZirU family protein n=1 Tax=Edwardsiella tarda TaxID=636 RepID=UPI000D509FC1|nr:ZirU family protein [Edwardsiella tarda]UCQ55545.1 ZirU family protein [Edwardsiella tarda]